MSFPDVRRGRLPGRVVALVALAGFLGSTAPAGPASGRPGLEAATAPVQWQAPQPTVIRHHVLSQATKLNFEQATASCGPGEQLLSGGYQMRRADEVLGSFPSQANGEPVPDGAVADSWTVVVRVHPEKPDGQPAVDVYVACVADPLWSSRSYVTSQTFGVDMTLTQTTCPGDTRLTGGGFQVTSDPATEVPESVVASLPDIAPLRWTAYGLLVRDPDGGIFGLPEFTYAVCASRPGLDTTVERGPALLQPPDPNPFCRDRDGQLVCDVHRVGEAFLTCRSGVLVAGATAPFRLDPGGAFEPKARDQNSQVTVSLPGRPFEPSDEPGWSVTIEYDLEAAPADDPAVKGDGQFPTLMVCATVVDTAPGVGVVNPPPTTAPAVAEPATRNLSATVRTLLPWAALGALVVIVATLALRSVRKRARRSRARTAGPAAPTLVTIEPATPTDVIRMAGPHVAVSALLLPGTASHTWTERTSP